MVEVVAVVVQCIRYKACSSQHHGWSASQLPNIVLNRNCVTSNQSGLHVTKIHPLP